MSDPQTTESPLTQRFTPRRKAAIINAIIEGHITEAQASKEYALSPEELTDWLKRMKMGGIKGLYVSPKDRRRVRLS